MGSSHSQLQNEDFFKQFQRNDWKQHKNLGIYELWENNKTGQLCEAYRLQYIPKQQDLQHYRFRHYNQNADNFVDIRYIQIQKKSTLCTSGESYVLTEFIPVKLSQMSNLSQIQGFALLKAAYRAFHTMQAFHGPFIPNQDLIGVNQSGKPKIWLNHNHSKNKAETLIQAEIWQKHLGQVSQNVKRTLQMVENKLRQKHFPEEFIKYYYDNNTNFSQASNYIDEYCEYKHIQTPESIDYIKYVNDAETREILNRYLQAKKEQNRMNTLNTVDNSNSHMVFVSNQVFNKPIIPQPSPEQFAKVYSQQPIMTVKPQALLRQTIVNRLPPQQFRMSMGNFVKPLITISPHNIQQRREFSSVGKNQQITPPSTHIPLQSNFNISSTSTTPMKFAVNFVKPKGQHLPVSTNSFTPFQKLSSQPSSLIVSPVVKETIKIPPKSVIIYNNNSTPKHISNNVFFVHPSAITVFENPKIQLTQTKRVSQTLDQNLRIIDRIMTIDTQQQHSIHQKIMNIDEQEQILIDNTTKNLHIHQKQSRQYQVYLDQDYHIQQQQSQSNQHHGSIPKHQEEFHNYINPDPQHEYIQSSGQIQDAQISQPDWQRIQLEREQERILHERQQQRNYNGKQYMNHNETHNQYTDFSHEIDLKQPINNHFVITPQNQRLQKSIQDDYAYQNKYSQKQQQGISPIKTNNEVKFKQPIDQNLAIFQKYAKINHYQQHQEKEIVQIVSNKTNQNHENLSIIQHIDLKPNITNKIYPNSKIQIVTDSSRNPISGNNITSIDKRRAQLFEQQEKSELKFNTSSREENTSGRLAQDSQNTLIVHESKQNLYHNVIKYGSKTEAIVIKNMNKMQHHSDFDSIPEINVNNSISNNQTNPIQQQGSYQNLHFRHQSDELYQYTPVDSVYRPINQQNRNSGVEDIVKLENHDDIQAYVRRKYSNIISGPTQVNQGSNDCSSNPRTTKSKARVMTFAKQMDELPQPVKNKLNNLAKKDNIQEERVEKIIKIGSIHKIQSKEYNLLSNPKSKPFQIFLRDDEDFLDVSNLQKSLDKRYQSHPYQSSSPTTVPFPVPSPNNRNKYSQIMSDQDGMNVAALQKKLVKFQQRQSIQRQKSQKRLQIYKQQLPNSDKQLNFHELDNIVQLMDKKIQQSQKKLRQSSSNTQNKTQSHYQSKNNNAKKQPNYFQSLDLQASFSQKQISLNEMPILKQQHISNDSHDRGYYEIDSSRVEAKGFSYYATSSRRGSENQRSYPNKMYEKRQGEGLNKGQQMGRNQQLTPKNIVSNSNSARSKTSSNNYSNKSNISNANSSSSQLQARSKNSQNVKRLTDQISSKYEKYLGSNQDIESTNFFDSDKPISKNASSKPYMSSKSFSNVNSQVSKPSRTSANYHKRKPSYLNTIAESYGQNNASPLKQIDMHNKNVYGQNYEQVKEINPISSESAKNNQENYLKNSNRNSKVGSKNSIISSEIPNKRTSSKISYEQLRELLWK